MAFLEALTGNVVSLGNQTYITISCIYRYIREVTARWATRWKDFASGRPS